MAALVISVVYALMSTLASLFNAAAIHGMMVIMDNDLLKISASGNVMQILDDVFVNSNILTKGISANISAVIMTVSYSLIILLMLVETISSMINSAQGEAAENPIKILIRGVITIFLEFLIFGNPFKTDNSSLFAGGGLLMQAGNWMANVLAPFGNDIDKINSTVGAISFSPTVSPVETIVLLVLSFALFKGALEAGVVFVERWLTFAISTLFGPIAIAMNVSTKTNQSFSKWLTSVLSQLLTIFISMLILNFFISSLWAQSESLAVFNSAALFKYAISISLLALFKNSEKILNSYGIFTIATKDSAKEIAAGAKVVTGFGMSAFKAVTSGKLKGYQAAGRSSVAKGVTDMVNPFTKYYTSRQGTTVSSSSKGYSSNNSSENLTSSLLNTQVSSNSASRLSDALSASGNAVSMQDVMSAMGKNDAALINEQYRNISPIAKSFTTDNGKKGVLFTAESTVDGSRKVLSLTMGDSLEQSDNIRTFNTLNSPASYSCSDSSAIKVDNGKTESFIQEISSVKPLSETAFYKNEQLSSAFGGNYTRYADSLKHNSEACASIQQYLDNPDFADSQISSWSASLNSGLTDTVSKHINTENETIRILKDMGINDLAQYDSRLDSSVNINRPDTFSNEELYKGLGVKNPGSKDR